MMKSMKDERIVSQVHRFGNEAFFITMAIIFVDIFYKSIILDVSFKSSLFELVVILVSCSYYTIRCMLGGIYTTPSKPKDRSKLIKQFILGSVISSIVWGAMLAIRNMYLYQGGILNWLTLAVFFVSALSFFVLIVVTFIVIYSISGKHVNRNSEE